MYSVNIVLTFFALSMPPSSKAPSPAPLAFARYDTCGHSFAFVSNKRYEWSNVRVPSPTHIITQVLHNYDSTDSINQITRE